MTRQRKIMEGAVNRLARIRRVDYPEDVERLRREVPGLEMISPADVALLWREWSDREHCAGWLGLDEFYVTQFADWLADGAEDAP